MKNIGMINADMFGWPREIGEHCDWSTPDYWNDMEWADFFGISIEEYAATTPHMIIWEVE